MGNQNDLEFAQETNEHGQCKVYLRNPSPLEWKVQRGEIVATAEAMPEEVQHTPAELAALSKRIFAKDQRLRTPDKVIKPNGLQRKALNERIEETVKKFPAQVREAARSTFRRYSNIFSASKTDLGKEPATEHDINLRSREPTYAKQFSIPDAHMETIKTHMRDWLKLGIVESTKSPFNAPIFCVPKKEGHGLRVVLDYRRLNAATLPDKYSMRTVDDCLMEIGRKRSKIFSTIDLTSGFWQMQLAKGARPYTAFTIPGWGQFQWTRGAMGLTGCPASFARMMDAMFAYHENIIAYIDDLLIHSRTWEEHVQHLAAAFQILEEHNLKVNLEKCEFGRDSVNYLGHVISEQGATPGHDKTEAIRRAQPPTTIRAVKSFIGLCNFFRAYIRDFSAVAAPLLNLTRGNSKWKGGDLPPQALASFKDLQQQLTKQPCLAFPTSDGEFQLYTDASGGVDGAEGAFGAALTQVQGGEKTNDRICKPDDSRSTRRTTVHTSWKRRPSSTRSNISAISLKAVHSQCSLTTVRLPRCPPRTRRPSAAWSNYSWNSPSTSGTSRAATTRSPTSCPVKDGYSRTRTTAWAFPHSTRANSASRQHKTRTHSASRCVRPWLETKRRTSAAGCSSRTSRTPTAFSGSLSGHTRARCQGKATRVLAPKVLRPYLIKQGHDAAIAGHGGIFKTKERIAAEFWWPCMVDDVAAHIRACDACNAARQHTKQHDTGITPLPQPAQPNDRVHIDLFGPLRNEHDQQRFIMVITDAFSKIVRLQSIPDKSATTVAEAVMHGWITIYGVPKTIVSDQGREFCNKLLKGIWELLQVEHKTTSPYHPKANAQAEVFNKTMAQYLTTMIASSDKTIKEWESMLGPLMLAHNTAVHRATRMTPFYAMFGYDPNLPLWPDMEVLDETFRVSPAKTTEEEALRAFHRRQAAARMLAGTNNTAERQRYAREPADDGPAFLKQQKVWIRTTLMPGKNQKLRPRWEKAIIIEETHPSVFKVRRFKGNKRTKTLNAERIRPRTDDLAPSEADDADDDDSDDEQEPDDPAQAVQELIAQLTADLADDVEAWASTMEEWSLRDLQKLFTRAGRPAARLFGLLGPQGNRRARARKLRPSKKCPLSPSSDEDMDMDYEEVASCRTVPPTARAEEADAGRIIHPEAPAPP